MKNKIKNLAIIIILCAFCLQCQSQVINLDGKNYLDMPFNQADFDSKNVFYEIACQGHDLNNDGLEDIILFLDYSETFLRTVSIKEKRKKSTLICLQEPSGYYRVTAHNLRFLYFSGKSNVECSKGGFIITTEGDRYDNHTYRMVFTYKDNGFYMTNKIVLSDFEDQPLENILINDKSVPLEGFSLSTFFSKYMIERDARQKKMYPEG